MPKLSKTYKYSVELHVHVVDAPTARLTTNGNVYVNICLLGIHNRTQFLAPILPLQFNKKLYFEKRLEREHVLIELIQKSVSSPVILATYERSAKEFLYPYSIERVQYVGIPRYIVLDRTIDFPGTSPSLEFVVHPSIEELTGRRKNRTAPSQRKPVDSFGKAPKRSKSVVWKPTLPCHLRSPSNDSCYVSSSVTSPTIASAVKHDYAKRSTKEKLHELTVPGEVKYVVHIDQTDGRRPFVVKHVDDKLIGRQPQGHVVFDDGLIVNDYSLSRINSSLSLSLNDGFNRCRSASPVAYRRPCYRKVRARSVSPCRCASGLSRSNDFGCREHIKATGRRRRRSPARKKRPCSHLNVYGPEDEIHPTRTCYICRLHRFHNEQSRRARLLDQPTRNPAPYKPYSPALYANGTSPYFNSTKPFRTSLHYSHRPSPAGELSDKILHTLRHNLDSFRARPWHKYYSSFRYSDGHVDDDELVERSRRFTQDK